MKNRYLPAAFGASGILILILDSETALRGASEGITICIQTLIPSLFPFFVLSSVVTASCSGMTLPFLSAAGKLCHIPKGAESLLAVGILGGYPVGAQCVAQACSQEIISRKDAEKMMVFCNNAGPSFIFGIVASQFSNPHIGWLIWGVQICSALIAGMLLSAESSQSTGVYKSTMPSMTQIMERAMRAMAAVCGWVILFRMALYFLDRWILWALPGEIRICAAAILELANGCLLLGNVENEGLRFVLSCAFLSFGGLCVTMQTASMSNGISLRHYLPGKLIQTMMCVILSMWAQYLLPDRLRFPVSRTFLVIISLLAAGTILCLRIRKKRCSNPEPVVV